MGFHAKKKRKKSFWIALDILDTVTTTQHEKQNKTPWLIAQRMVFLLGFTHCKWGHVLFKNLNIWMLHNSMCKFNLTWKNKKNVCKSESTVKNDLVAH